VGTLRSDIVREALVIVYCINGEWESGEYLGINCLGPLGASDLIYGPPRSIRTDTEPNHPPTPHKSLYWSIVGQVKRRSSVSDLLDGGMKAGTVEWRGGLGRVGERADESRVFPAEYE
jgi:hypothetical protein